MTALTSPATKAARPTLATGARDRRGGFTLIEMVLALAIISLVASLALPWSAPGASRASLRTKALEISALLRADRDAALRTGRTVETRLDANAGWLRSGASDAAVRLPEAHDVQAVPRTLASIAFFGDGRSSGGGLAIGTAGDGYLIEVDAFTAAVGVAEGR